MLYGLYSIGYSEYSTGSTQLNRLLRSPVSVGSVQGDSGKVSAADMKTLLNEAEKFLPSSAAGAADIKALTEAVKSKFKSRKPCMQASPLIRSIYTKVASLEYPYFFDSKFKSKGPHPRTCTQRTYHEPLPAPQRQAAVHPPTGWRTQSKALSERAVLWFGRPPLTH